MVQNGKVKIYLADIRPLFDETMQKKALAQLDEIRRQKALSGSRIFLYRMGDGHF